MNVQIKPIARRVIEAAATAKEGHIPSSLSILDLLFVLYERKITTGGHVFVLSKGHASLAMYSILEEFGLLEKGETQTFCKFDSRLGGHPDKNKIPGIMVSSGSLGHGLPIAVGIAKANKITKGEKRVFCLVGDGECNEGSIWEAMLISSHHGLNNLCVILDYNRSGDRAILIDSMTSKASSFGFHVIEIDGHNHSEITAALDFCDSTQPIFIIANTVKGKGITELENNPAWHHRAPVREELDAMLRALS